MALEALASRQTVNEIAGADEVHPNQVTTWKREAHALLNLRCVALNDEWEPFINHSIHQETTRLYAHCPIQPQPARLRLVA